MSGGGAAGCFLAAPSVVILAALLIGTFLPGQHGVIKWTCALPVPAANASESGASRDEVGENATSELRSLHPQKPPKSGVVVSATGTLLPRYAEGDNCARWRLWHPVQPLGAKMADWAVRRLGPLLPFVLLLPLFYEEVIAGTKESGWTWNLRAYVLFCFITVARVVLYLPFFSHPGWNYHFSDHIFLLCSLVAQVQMATHITLRIDRRSSPKPQWVVPVDAILRRPLHSFYSWTLIGLFFLEMLWTSKDYHTVPASWLAYLAGTLFFTGIAGLEWYVTREEEPPPSNSNNAAAEPFLASNEVAPLSNGNHGNYVNGNNLLQVNGNNHVV